MIKVMACFKRPEDPIDFMNQFQKDYLPLALKIPGLSDNVINLVKGDNFGKDTAFYLIHELHFPNKQVFKNAMESRENQVAGKKLMTFARGYVTLMVTETTDVQPEHAPSELSQAVGRR